jgi:hypothetical protein
VFKAAVVVLTVGDTIAIRTMSELTPDLLDRRRAAKPAALG